jgi:hypothetical protein
LRRKCCAARRLCTLLSETLPPPADNENPPGPHVPSRRGSLPPGLPAPSRPAPPPASRRPPPNQRSRGIEPATSRSWSQSVVPTTVYAHLWLARPRPPAEPPRQCLAWLRRPAPWPPLHQMRQVITARGGVDQTKPPTAFFPAVPDPRPLLGWGSAAAGRKTPAPPAMARDHAAGGFSVIRPGVAASPLWAEFCRPYRRG